jgi:CheY-like chemotaxis protein
MTKIMLVEDDKSLREIYGVRLLAEGYDIVSAGDGEEALAMAIKERPKLIISDVMMPKISGFDMLDILRSTTETRDIKVIMMTALSSEDQRQRGEQMGADRYLVKSQVGIEDVVRVVHEVLGDGTAAKSAPPQSAAPAPAQAIPTPPPAPRPPAAAPMAPAAPMPAPQRAPVPPASAATALPHQQAPQSGTPHDMPPISSTTASPPSARQRIIQPIANNASKVDINDLLNKELAREAGVTPATTAQERATIQSQLSSFGQQPGSQPNPAAPPAAPQQPPTGHINVEVPERPTQPPNDDK